MQSLQCHPTTHVFKAGLAVTSWLIYPNCQCSSQVPVWFFSLISCSDKDLHDLGYDILDLGQYLVCKHLNYRFYWLDYVPLTQVTLDYVRSGHIWLGYISFIRSGFARLCYNKKSLTLLYQITSKCLGVQHSARHGTTQDNTTGRHFSGVLIIITLDSTVNTVFLKFYYIFKHYHNYFMRISLATKHASFSANTILLKLFRCLCLTQNHCTS